MVSALLLGIPLALGRRGRRAEDSERSMAALPAVLYFGAIGAGFIGIEVALMQKLVLLVGHPLYSVTVTLASMLLATGLGAYLSRKRFDAQTLAIWIVPVGLALLLGLLSAVDHDLVRWAAPFPMAVRFGVAATIVVPIGLLVGIPFAHGLRLVERADPGLVPWALGHQCRRHGRRFDRDGDRLDELWFPRRVRGGCLLYVLAAWCAAKLQGKPSPTA